MAKKKAQRKKSSSLSPVPVIGLLLASGAAAGVLYNMLSPRGIFRPAPAVTAVAEVQEETPSAPSGKPSGGPEAGLARSTGSGATPEPMPVELLDLAGMKKVLAEGSAIIVDARSAQSYEFGHVPGAISLPAPDFEAAYEARKSLLPPGLRIVVYCTSANCDESEQVLEGLKARGHKRLLHYKNGWNEYELAGLPVEKSMAAGN